MGNWNSLWQLLRQVLKDLQQHGLQEALRSLTPYHQRFDSHTALMMCWVCSLFTSPWVFLMGVGPIWLSIGYSAYNMNFFFKSCGGMLGGSVQIWTKSNLFWFIQGGGGVQTNSSTSWHAKLSLTLNIYRKNVLCWNLQTTSKVLYAKQPTPD